MQSGKPMACAGRAVDEVEPVAAGPLAAPEVVLLPLRLVLPVLVEVSLRTCLVTGSQHFVPVAAVPGEVVDEEVWAAAIPMPPASSAAAAISAVLVIAMQRILLFGEPKVAACKATEVSGSGSCRKSAVANGRHNVRPGRQSM